MHFNTLIPELAVRDCQKSLNFYRDILGFSIVYQRVEEGFAFLELEGAQLMLDQMDKGRTFFNFDGINADSFGRGINLQIKVSSVKPLLGALNTAGISLYLPLEEKWYVCKDGKVGQRQFIVADPDGYLLRFFENIDT